MGALFRRLVTPRGRPPDEPPRLADVHPQWPIGVHSYGWPQIHDFGGAGLWIGDYCSISHNVHILLGGEHRPDWVTTYPFPAMAPWKREDSGHPASRGDVRIGHDVWVGMGALLLSGATVGNGAVVGAGAVIRGEVPAYAVVAGNPAEVVRYRFDADIVAKLERIKWWEWPEADVRAAVPYLTSDDVAAFIAYAAGRGTSVDR